MLNYASIPVLIAVPILLSSVKAYRKGLITGLFVSLIFLGSGELLLLLVPLAAAVCMFYTAKKSEGEDSGGLYVKNPAASMLTVFLLSMIIFCAGSDAFFHYGQYLRLADDVLLLTGQVAPIGAFIGPILVGNWCDRKGPFSATIFLTLLSALSVSLAGCGDQSTVLFILGNFLVYLSTSGFFVLMPLVSEAFFGKTNFFRFYIPIAVNAVLLWAGARYVYNAGGSALGNPGEFLLSLMFLVLLSAFFAVIAWKRRFVLVRPPKTAQKTGS